MRRQTPCRVRVRQRGKVLFSQDPAVGGSRPGQRGVKEGGRRRGEKTLRGGTEGSMSFVDRRRARAAGGGGGGGGGVGVARSERLESGRVLQTVQSSAAQWAVGARGNFLYLFGLYNEQKTTQHSYKSRYGPSRPRDRSAGLKVRSAGGPAASSSTPPLSRACLAPPCPPPCPPPRAVQASPWRERHRWSRALSA